jgi:hypothetical protein
MITSIAYVGESPNMLQRSYSTTRNTWMTFTAAGEHAHVKKQLTGAR